MRKKISLLAISLVMLLFVAPKTVMAAIPSLPHAFYGSVTINGSPAPVGTVVSANVSRGGGSITTTEVGKYGGAGVLSPKLIVQGDILDGTLITFEVNGVSTGQTAHFASGTTSEIDLSVDIEVPPTTTPPTTTTTPPTTPPPPPPPPPTTVAPQGLTPSVPLRVDEQGIVQDSTQLSSPGDEVTLDIPSGTQMLDANGSPLETITLEELVTPPAPPPAGAIVLAYDFGPDGATFEPAIELKLTYNPADLPEGVNEADLRIAWWDGTEWVMLDSTVNTTTHTISAFVSHFTSFALLGTVAAPPTPAAFTVSNLTVEPASITPGGTVTITVTVTNSGETRGTHTVVLNINGAKEAEKSITLNGGASGNVSFTASRSAAGTYTVTIGALSKTFIIRDVPFEPKPAEFVLSALSVQPAEVAPGEAVIISVTVTNSGEVEGTYTVILNINGAKEAEKSIALDGGKSGQVNFTVSRSTTGTYTVAVGNLSATFTVSEAVVPPPPKAVNWPLIAGIIGAVLLAIVAIFLFIRARNV